MSELKPTSVEDVLHFYNTEVHDALATAMIFENDFPDAVLNEIRNAMTHLGRSINPKLNSVDKEAELASAYRHLKRTCLDSFKLSILFLAEELDRMITALEDQYLLPEKLHSQLIQLRERRIKMQVREGVKLPDDVVLNEYKALFNDYDACRAELLEDYGSDTSSGRREIKKRRIRKREALGWVVAFLVGIASSLAASWIWGLAG